MVLFRLHILALPHTITLPKYSHCAFTSKVLRFAPMMRSRGYEVYHYGIETSEAGANKHIDLLSLTEWNNLRIKAYIELHPKCTEKQAEEILLTESSFVGDLGNSSTSLYKTFNERLRNLLPLHYRSPSTDLVCLPFGHVHNAGLSGLNVVSVESGIGYFNSCADYRIFESSALMHKTLEQEKKTQGQHYWFVIPMGFDVTDFSICTDKICADKRPRVGYLGRICEDKGCRIVLELAKRMPHTDFIICGQGNPTPFLDKTVANFFYEPPVSGSKNRLDFYHSLTAFISPTMYLEPFGAAVVEAQLCGLPVLTPDFGAFLETVEQDRTGYRCHTLADYAHGVTQALQGFFDPIYIRERAKEKYDMYKVARDYDMAFRNILNIHNGANGWYGQDSFLSL